MKLYDTGRRSDAEARRRCRLAALSTSVCLAACATPALAQVEPPAEAVSGLEDIVVTAQKREQNLQDVPVSITAISQNSLIANRIVNVQDLGGVAPNLTIRQPTGGSMFAGYTMRGLYTSGSLTGQDKGVALYVDGVYVQNSAGSLFELADIARIEVLRGPQGTLFGRNATGGAISLITREPTGIFGVRQEVSYGNRDYIRSKTRVESPQFGPLSLTAIYTHSEQRGDTRNIGGGTRWDYSLATKGKYGFITSPKWLGSNNVDAVAVSAKLEASDDLTAVYRFDYTENHYTPGANGSAYLAPAIAAIYNMRVPQSQRTPATNQRPEAVNNWFTTPGFLKNYSHNLTVNYRLSDAVTFKNILATRYNKLGNFQNQFDGIGGLVTGAGATCAATAAAPAGTPCILTANGTGSTQKQWSNEVQINVTTDWFKLTAGYLHFHDKANVDLFDGVRAGFVATAMPGFVVPAPPPGLLPGQQVVRGFAVSNSDAVFIQPEVNLTDKLAVVLGGRLTMDEKMGSFRGIGFTPYSNSKATWLAGVNYKLNRDTLAYAKYSTGYISGGNYFGIAYGDETSVSWEAGLKTELFDRRLRSNLALFSVKYGALQLSQTGRTIGRPDLSSVILNSGDARVKGFEWENTLVPIDRLTLTGAVGYAHFKYIASTLNPLIFPNAPGQVFRPGNRPTWSLSTAMEYATVPIFAEAFILARVDGNYKSKEFMRYSDNPTVLAAGPDPAYLDSTTVGARWLVNGRLALKNLEVGGTTAEIGLWGRNILNNRDITFISASIYTFNPTAYEREQSYGLDVNISF